MSEQPLHEALNCLGRFGFGNGYTVSDGLTYCDTLCPAKYACWKQHRSKVENDEPEMTDKFHQLVLNIAAKRLISMDAAAKYASNELFRFGTPDPYVKASLVNFDIGMDKRRQDDPDVVNRPVGRRQG